MALLAVYCAAAVDCYAAKFALSSSGVDLPMADCELFVEVLGVSKRLQRGLMAELLAFQEEGLYLVSRPINCIDLSGQFYLLREEFSVVAAVVVVELVANSVAVAGDCGGIPAVGEAIVRTDG